MGLGTNIKTKINKGAKLIVLIYFYFFLTLQILAGLLNPTNGTVYVKRPRSFVFQNPDHQVNLILLSLFMLSLLVATFVIVKHMLWRWGFKNGVLDRTWVFC